jgi:hypothetical protein
MVQRKSLFVPVIVLLSLGIVCLFAVMAGGDVDFGQRDSPEYYASGLSIVEGRGLTVPFGEPGGHLTLDAPSSPLTFYPPGFPVVFGLLVWAGIPATAAPVTLQACLAGALGAALGYQVWRVTSSWVRSMVAALAGWSAGLYLGDEFLSEPLYLLVVALVISCLARYMGERRTSILVIGSLLAACASLVRVIGVALALPAAMAVVLSGVARQRVWKRLAVVATMIIPVGLWFLSTSHGSPLGFAFHPFGLTDLKVAATSLSIWVVPLQVPYGLRVALAAVVAGALLSVLLAHGGKPLRTGNGGSLSSLWMAYALAHLGLLVAVMSFANGQTEADTRQLAPVGLAFVIAVLSGTPASKTSTAMLTSVAVAVVGIGIAGFVGLKTESGYGEEPWSSSNALEYIQELETRFVLSNSPDGIWINTRRSTYSIPSAVNPWTERPNPRISDELREVQDLADEEHVVLVYFENVNRDYFVEPEIFIRSGFEISRRFSDAIVLTNSR